MQTIQLPLNAQPLTPNSVTLVSSKEALERWTTYPMFVSEETIENWLANPITNKYLTRDTASSSYYLNGLEIFTSTKGDYYYLDISKRHKSFFCHGDTLPVDELTLLSDELLSEVRDLAEADRSVSPYGFRLVEIVYHDADHVMFTLYSTELQHYCMVERMSFECIGADTHAQLAKSTPDPNVLTDATELVLDDDGNILRYEGARLYV